jgi:hypothetical protein
MVTADTKPRSQRTNKIIAIVQSIRSKVSRFKVISEKGQFAREVFALLLKVRFCEKSWISRYQSRFAKSGSISSHTPGHQSSLSITYVSSASDKNSSRCRRIKSSRAVCAVMDGSPGKEAERFRQTHSSTASTTSCCLEIPRNSLCFVSHSNCVELTTICNHAGEPSGSSGVGLESLVRTDWIAAEPPIGCNRISAFRRPESASQTVQKK